MSEYATINTEYRDVNALIAALLETQGGRTPWTAADIERHDKPAALVDYHGKVRPDAAHLIIRREKIGAASNDLGFVRTPTGTYQMIVSDFDVGAGEYADYKHGRLNADWQRRLKCNYAYHAVRISQQRYGRTVTRTWNGQKQVLTVKGF